MQKLMAQESIQVVDFAECAHGLKDPDTALRDMPTVTPVPVDPAAVVAALGLG
jgi:hypothetical protein